MCNWLKNLVTKDDEEEKQPLGILERVDGLFDLLPFQVAIQDTCVVRSDPMDSQDAFILGQELRPHRWSREKEIDEGAC